MKKFLTPDVAFAIFAISFFFSGCGYKRQGSSEVATVISEDQLGRRLTLLNKQYGAGEVCEDFEIFKQVAAHVEPLEEVVQYGEEPCPGTFGQLARKIAEITQSWQDLHASVEFGRGLDASASPVITTCTGSDDCPSLIGMQIVGLLSSVDSHLYAYVPTPGGPTFIKALEVTSVDGLTYERLASDALAGHRISWSKDGVASFLAPYELSKQALDLRDHTLLSVQVKDIVSSKTMLVQASYEPPQSVIIAQTDLSSLGHLAVRRDYDCSVTTTTYNNDSGFCISTSGSLTAWIGLWSDDLYGKFGFLHGLSEQLARQTGESPPILLDVRGNPGGSPLAVVQFLCATGDDTEVAAMAARDYEISEWPQSFATTSGKIFQWADLKPSANTDVHLVADGWKSQPVDGNLRKTTSLNLLTRAHLNDETCRSLRLAGSGTLKWRIITDGSEFSATELFLSLARTQSGQFEIFGKQSRGGSGSPTTITLPNTRIKVTLSQARQIDRLTGTHPIERLGVTPSHQVPSDTPEDFEREFKAVAAHLTSSHKPQQVISDAISYKW